MSARFTAITWLGRIFVFGGRKLPRRLRMMLALHGVLPFVGIAAGTETIAIIIATYLPWSELPLSVVRQMGGGFTAPWYNSPLGVSTITFAITLWSIYLLRSPMLSTVEERLLTLFAVLLSLNSLPVLDIEFRLSIVVVVLVLCWTLFPRLLVFLGLAEEVDENGHENW